jgi:DNA-binding transcriptional regulator WhiA
MTSEVARASANFRAANEQRTRRAAERDVEIARLIVAGWGLDGQPSPAELRAARARAASPGASWAQVAAAAGMTKSQTTSAFRRLRIRCGW